MNIVITAVNWDTDDGEVVISEDHLPILILDCLDNGKLCLDIDHEEVVGGMISDETGWCHKDWTWELASGADQETLDNIKKIMQYEG